MPEFLEDGAFLGRGFISNYTSGRFFGEIDFAFDADRFSIVLYAGITYTIDLSKSDFDDLDPYLFLLDGVGSVIDQDDDGAGGFNSRIVFTPDETDTYFIEAQARINPFTFETTTGSYVVDVFVQADDTPPGAYTGGAQPDAPTLTLGVAREGLIEYPTDSDTYAIDLAPGAYTITVEGIGRDGADETTTDALEEILIRVRNGDGSVIPGLFVADDDGEAVFNLQVFVQDSLLIDVEEAQDFGLLGVPDTTGGYSIVVRADQPSLSVADAVVTEGGGAVSLSFTVTLSAAAGGPVTVAYATADGTARAGSDYTAASGTVTFAAGERTKTVTVAVTPDDLLEADETLLLRLSAPAGATIADGEATGTIRNDDVARSVSVADAVVTEGGGAVSLSFTVTLSTAASGPVTVAYATADGTARAGTDYTAASGTVTFAAGERTKTVTVAVTPDDLPELDETLLLRLSAPVGASIADGEATGTIRNDDVPRISVADAAVAEGVTGTRPLVFTVTLDRAAAGPVTVDYATRNGAATAGSDFTAVSGRLTFAAGERSKTVTVQVIGDALREATETFDLVLSAPVGATLADGVAQGRIIADEAATAGNDTLLSGPGDDVLDGLGGIDAVSYEAIARGVRVDLGVTTAQNTVGAGRDTIRNVENLIGGTGNDVLTGNAGANFIEGLRGNDTLAGGGGRDTLKGGAGDDVYLLRTGRETLIEVEAGGRDRVVSPASTTRLGGQFEDLTLGLGGNVGIGNFLGNRITGNDGRNLLLGQGGNDTLVGNGGFDRLFGGTGNDWLRDGTDKAPDEDGVIRPLAPFDPFDPDALYTLPDRGGRLHGEAGNDTIEGGEGAYAYGGRGADLIVTGDRSRIWGDDFNNRSAGEADVILAGGRSVVAAGGGADFIGAGLGSQISGDTGDDILFVDGELGTGAGATRLDGGVGDDVFFLNARSTGAVTLADASGDDLLLLQDFDSTTTLAFRRGNDLVVQLFDPDSETAAVYATVTFANQYRGANTLEFLAFTEEGARDEDPLQYRLRRSPIGTDENELIAGTNAADTVNGAGGDDILFGADGADRLIGDNEIDGSDDILAGGRGADTLLGGNGEDQFRFRREDLGTGIDLIDDFDITNDVLDLIDLLRACEDANPVAAGFLRGRQVGADLVIDVDLDGASQGARLGDWIAVVRLVGVERRNFDFAADFSDPTANVLF
jgi:Ca2+-binding RTX toxin-like protein